jgi:hypothetical protein
MRQWASNMKRVLRLGFPALAIYALVLQAFLAGAAPAAAFDPAGAQICAEWSAGHDQPAPDGPHHHGLCVAQCAPAAFAGLIDGAAAPGPLVRVALLAPLTPAAEDRAHAFSRHRGPGARAPPRG